MDALIILLVGYVILKSIFSGGDDYDKKPKHRKRRKKSSFWDDTPTYSDYDTWNRSHGDRKESATTPVEQRTRAELFLYIRLWIIQIPLLKFLL